MKQVKQHFLVLWHQQCKMLNGKTSFINWTTLGNEQNKMFKESFSFCVVSYLFKTEEEQSKIVLSYFWYKYLRFIQIRFIKPPTHHNPVLFPLCPGSWDEYWKAKCQQSLLEDGCYAALMEDGAHLVIWFYHLKVYPDALVGKTQMRWKTKIAILFTTLWDWWKYLHILHYFFICLWESDNSWKLWFFGQLLRDWQFGKCKIFQSKNSFDLQKKGTEIERCMWKGWNLFGKRWKECKVEMSLNFSTTQNKSQ